MSPAGVFDESDILSMAAPELQRALLKAPDDLIAQAVARAPERVAERVLGNLSPRRAKAVRATAQRLLDSGELGPQAARTALRNLVCRVFEVAAPEAEGREASRSVGPARAAAGAFSAEEARRDPEPRTRPGPDLKPLAFAKLRETRAVLDAARRISPFVQELERARLGANAAVLARAWMGRPPRRVAPHTER